MPKEVRKKRKLKPGQKLNWVISDNVVTLMPLPTNWGTYMWGLGKEVWKGVNIFEELEVVKLV